ncbi:MAG TPA: glycosyltransferase family 39 protein [Anaerolineales bacterium]|nr:glycosyltransferase family 39 protein [Anaerolineales bacterium]
MLRLYIINDPIGYDEAYTFINFSSKPFKFILADYHAPNNHILNSLIIGFVYRMLGNHIWIVRVPAFIASVLSVPVSFVTARRFFTAQQSLGVAATLAVAPNLVETAANGRGYPLIILFSLLLLNFAGILVKNQSLSALTAYAITGALGFYSIPIFLYPMAGISLWVAATYLSDDEIWQSKSIKLKNFLIACAASGALTLLLYSPVIIFGTGFESLIANDIVKPQSWQDFSENSVALSAYTWRNWMAPLAPIVRYILGLGFFLSVIFYRNTSNQKLPLQIFILFSTGVIVVLQRVFPLPRIWSFLEMLYLLFAATGLIGTLHLVLKIIKMEKFNQVVLPIIISAIALSVFTNVTLKTQNRQARLNRTIAPEKFAADYLTEHLTDEDTIIAVAPADIRTAYYLKINGVSYDFFYQRDHPVEIQNAMVLVRTHGEYNINTLEKVLDFYKLTSKLDVSSTQQVFEYGPLFIYSIPAN